MSKPDSTSSLTVLDPEDAAAAPVHNPDPARLQHIVSTLRKELGMTLLGVDVVIEHGSGRYGIIDINVFPSRWSTYGYIPFQYHNLYSFQCTFVFSQAMKNSHTFSSV